MTNTLYLKYRPKNLSELDLTSARESLERIVKSGNIPHALLFSGPKGTGKTSAARILAKVINCENRRKNSIVPCSKCDQCKSITNGSNLDVIELDAASHRGIDDMRSLKDAVKLSPSRALKKVYIIDEAHMLTTEASNALLKTLEEPPDHVVFILATTNPEKLIETIRSRTTNIKFSKASEEEIVRSLKRVSIGEKIKSDEGGLRLIAKASDGSFRDAIKNLEQLVSEGYVSKKEDVEKFFKNSGKVGEDLFECLSKKDLKGSLLIVERAVYEGTSIDILTKEILGRARKALLAKVGIGQEKLDGFSKEDLIRFIETLSEARNNFKNTPIESLPLEMSIIKWCGDTLSNFEEEEEVEEEEEIKEEMVKKVKPFKKKAFKVKKNLNAVKEIGDDVWEKILSRVKPINSSIEALLRSSRPLGLDGKTFNVGVYYKFHKERLEDVRHRKVLEGIVGDVLGFSARIKCIVTDQPKKQISHKEDAPEVALSDGEDKNLVKAAEEIFGN